MRFTLSVTTDNDAFHEAPDAMPAELVRILGNVSDRINRNEAFPLTILDHNGNTVGQARLE